MERIESLYKTKGYLETFGWDIVISALLIILTVGITSVSTYKSVLSQAKANWNLNRCKPIYLPFAGVIMPQPGQSALETSAQNFQYCIQQDSSMVMNIVLMPFEFAMFIIIEFLDSVMAAISAIMRLILWLKNVIGGIFKQIYNKIVKFIIPLMVIIIKLRDMLAKMNGVMVTSLFTIMNIYNIMVSGILNIMIVLNNILIIVIAVMVALIVLALILMFTPAFPAGFAFFAVGLGIMTVFIIPVIILYTMMQVFTTAVLKATSPPAQEKPNIKRRRRK